MASNQAIKYAPQYGDITVDSFVFHNKNVVGIFGYPENAPAYHDICKYLMNCPLAEAFTKSPLVVYQNLLREFWCIAIASHLNPPTDDSEARPLKEYLIKFSVMNGKKPLTIDFKAFTVSTGLDYAKGKYVSHPFTKEVLGGNYSSTEQVNSIQQLFAYCLLTRIKGPKDSGSLPQRRKKPKSKTSPLELTEDSEQSHSISLGHIPDPQDLERNKQLTGTGLPSTQLDEGTRKLQLFPEGTRSDPKDSMGNKQPIDTGLPSTVSDEGTINTTPLPEGTRRDKDLEGL
ncbi:hypothetical protein Tco_1058262 [Tanacetum coccineum]|uniref:Uncharacterized protein n=1 Tax=Tanacetum coccineum TaxID=301880 RepID=A0ABQ5H8D8_9ASTR